MEKIKYWISISMMIVLSCIDSGAQKLPSAYHYQDNGRQLVRDDANTVGFYDLNTIDTIYLEFKQSDYWKLLTSNYSNKTNIPATLTYKGKVFDSVGVRFKGMTSYMMVSSEKKSFNISLDFVHEKQDIDGYTTLNLNNSFQDPSMLREFLYSYFNRKNIPSAKANFVVLFINGDCRGPYVNVQQLDKQHSGEWFADANATRWRAEGESGFGGGGFGPPGMMSPPPGMTPPVGEDGQGENGRGKGFPEGGFPDGGFPDGDFPGGGFPEGGFPDGGFPEGGFPEGGFPEGGFRGMGGPGGGGFGGGGFGGMFGAGESSLNYLGDDTATYQKHYTLKKAYKNDPWNDLILASKILNTIPKDSLIDTLEKVMDIDGTLWFLAQEILFTDDDGYVSKGGMDYYVYFDVATNRIVPVEYDGNSTMLTRDAASWSPFFREDNEDFPLKNILFSIPELRQRYLAHVRTILKESLNSSVADSLIDHYAMLIDRYIETDTKNIYSYEKFKSEVAELKKFISVRNNYIASNEEVNRIVPEISSVNFRTREMVYSRPDENQEVIVNANVTSSLGIQKVILYYGTGITGAFNKIEMYDDGGHSDGKKGDHVYGAIIPPHSRNTLVRFYVEAVDATEKNTRSYSPEGAEHDVYVYRVEVAEKVESNVVINELMASNSTTVADKDGEFDDWIELYNKSKKDIDLTGYYLTDKSTNLEKWAFPLGTVIKKNDYLIVWADKDMKQSGLHANFKLSGDSEEVLLITPNMSVADHVNYSEAKPDLSFSRYEDGTGSFIWQFATFNGENGKKMNLAKNSNKKDNMLRQLFRGK